MSHTDSCTGLPVTPFLTLLILGPTGSGKTPLGDYLQEQGIEGRRCHHFDFGANLRRIAEEWKAPGLTEGDLQVIDDSLSGATLLENEHFPIAAKILTGFVATRGLGVDDVLLLNGLPRHCGQAADVDRLVRMTQVVRLDCPASVVLERLACDSGGDRAERIDDGMALVTRKLALFEERTTQLLDHYAQKGVSIQVIPVGVATTPEKVAAQLRVAAPQSAGQ